MKELVREVFIAKHLLEYAAKIVLATNPKTQYACPFVKNYVQYGSSPRGLQALILGAKVKALLDKRPQVSKQDIDSVLTPALRHRIITNFEAEAEKVTIDKILRKLKENQKLSE